MKGAVGWTEGVSGRCRRRSRPRHRWSLHIDQDRRAADRYREREIERECLSMGSRAVYVSECESSKLDVHVHARAREFRRKSMSVPNPHLPAKGWDGSRRFPRRARSECGGRTAGESVLGGTGNNKRRPGANAKFSNPYSHVTSNEWFDIISRMNEAVAPG